MSSAALDSVATEDARHRLAVAEGLLSSLDTERGLEGARRFLDGDLGVEQARAELKATADELREALGEADTTVDYPSQAQPGPRRRRRRKKKEDPMGDQLSEGVLSSAARDKLPDSAFALPGRRYPIHDEAHARNALARVSQHGTPEEKKKVRAKVKRKHPNIDMEEARVTGNPPVANSPSSQTGAEAAQNEPWGGPNAGALASLRAAGVDFTTPPNLREAEGWEACANCVFFNKGQCLLYGVGRKDGPDIIHNGGYPVERDDLCDSHTTVTPPEQQKIERAQKYVDRYLTEAHELGEAAAAGEGSRMVRARARFDLVDAKLEELGLHMPNVFDEMKHPRARGKFRSKGGPKKIGTNFQHLDDVLKSEAHKSSISSLKPGETHNVAKGVNVHNDPKHGLTTMAHGRVIQRHGTNVEDAARVAAELARRRQRRRDVPSTVRHQRYLQAGEEDDVERDLREVKSDAYPGLDRSPKENWVDKAGGLPRYIERIAKHLHYEKGKAIGHAIAIAVNVVKKMCASGDVNFPGKQSVNPKSRAEACAAVAQWEAKKGRSKAKTALQHADEQEAFERTLALVESVFKPIPPSWNFVESVLSEIAATDGADWYAGMSQLDEAMRTVEELGVEEAVERELVEVNVLRKLGFRWDEARHPRMGRGRGGGRFRKVLHSIQQDAEKSSAVNKVATFKSDSSGSRGASKKRRIGASPSKGAQRRQLDARLRNENRPNPAGSGARAATAASGSAMGSRMAAAIDDVASVQKKTVEQHFATDESGQEHIFPDGLYTLAARRSQRKPPGAAAPHDDLTVDLAIGGVLSEFPNVKDWSLEGPEKVDGVNVWNVHVELADGKKHVIAVDENGQVKLEGLAPQKTAKPKPVAPPQTGNYEPTGDSNVVSHMDPGTVFKGADSHLYKYHGHEWIQGKKGPVKAAHLENLDTGTHKNVPYFAIHGKEYPIHAPAGSFKPKPAGEPSSASDVFNDLLKSVSGQTGTVDSVKGKNVVVTGVIPGHTRDEAHALISAAGGSPQKSVTTATHVLVTGDKVGQTKINAAKKKGVTVVPWHEFKHLVEAELGPLRTKLALTEGAIVGASGADLVRLRARREVLRKRVGDPLGDRAGEIVEAVFGA